MTGKAEGPASWSTAHPMDARLDDLSTGGIYLCYFGTRFLTSTGNRAVPAPGRSG